MVSNSRRAAAAIAEARLGDVVALNPMDTPAVLIRPDGHLAWRGDDPASLQRWLDMALGSAKRQERLAR